MRVEVPQYADKKMLFDWLRQNKELLMQAKKAQMKHADPAMGHLVGATAKSSLLAKELATEGTVPVGDVINAKLVINTTNIMDSHSDVHIPGLWKKSLNELKVVYLIQEHQMKFDKVISDEMAAMAKTLTWKALGQDYEGSTQALIFDGPIKASRNAFMYDQYISGYVKNHSVGMRYIKMEFCVNSEEKWWRDEKENWDKYIEQVANREEAEEQGYFWAVLEAKIVEGSAVLVGSNQATPTMSITEAGKSTSENKDDNGDQPPHGTAKKSLFSSLGSKL